MNLTRRSGILLHPTSLWGPYGRGDLGPSARAFVDWLQGAGQRVWQILPLGPPGYGGSPYASSSAFAGDALLVSPELLVEDGLLDEVVLRDAPRYPEGAVDPEATRWRRHILSAARERFSGAAQLEAFREREAGWLEEHALFVALKDAHGGGAFWRCWPDALQRREPAALDVARDELRDAIELEVFAQFLFDQQWRALRDYARERDVELFGDLPIFVARDSSDVWARPELFLTDEHGAPSVVAGVPPDAFSEDGQLWGNPLYDWAVHEREGFAWWTRRLRRSMALMDMVRIDHFRGFAGYWEIPADAETAVSGRWVDGPRMALFDALRTELGEIPVVAEDLGEITPDVTELLESTGFPGMRILQFAWYDDDALHPFRPENHPVKSVVYTGTHDNETSAGWFAGLDAETRERLGGLLDPADPAWGLVELAQGSEAFLAIVPIQDLLAKGNEARTNTPGTVDGNWSWRLEPGDLSDGLRARLRELTAEHGRAPE